MRRLLLILLTLIVLLSGCSPSDPITDDIYTEGAIFIWDGAAYQPVTYATGNVSATANLDDNTIIRGDGGGVGVQDSGVTIDDFDNLNTNGGDLTGFDIYADNDVNVTNDLDVTDNGNIDGTLTVGEDIGIGVVAPSARLHLDAGTAAAGTAPIKFTAGTLLTTPEAGALEYDGTGTYLTNVNHRRFISLSSDSIITPVTVSNTANETTVFTAVLNANELKAQRVYRLNLYGEMSTASASDTIRIRVKINGTTLVDVTSTAGAVTDEPSHAKIVFTVRSTGMAGAISSYSELEIGAKEARINTSSVAVNTTIVNNIICTFQWSAAKVDNIATLDQAFLEVLD